MTAAQWARWLSFTPALVVMGLYLFLAADGPRLIHKLRVYWLTRGYPHEAIRPVYVRKPRPSTLRGGRR